MLTSDLLKLRWECLPLPVLLLPHSGGHLKKVEIFTFSFNSCFPDLTISDFPPFLSLLCPCPCFYSLVYPWWIWASAGSQNTEAGRIGPASTGRGQYPGGEEHACCLSTLLHSWPGGVSAGTTTLQAARPSWFSKGMDYFAFILFADSSTATLAGQESRF